MSFDKNLIAKNFSRSSKTYNEAAQIQLETAQNLIRLIADRLENDSEILDLGSGTSFVAKQIPNLNICEVDIAQDMLNSWVERPSNIKTLVADFENLPFSENSFDLILSSFALHWASDFKRIFSQYFKILRPKGIIAFAIPVEGSMPEMSMFNINDFPSADNLRSILSECGFEELFFIQKNSAQFFEKKIDAIKFLKRIGANSAQKNNLPSNFSRRKNLDKKISWKIAYFVFRK